METKLLLQQEQDAVSDCLELQAGAEVWTMTALLLHAVQKVTEPRAAAS